MLQNNNKNQTLMDKRCNRYLVVSSFHPALIFILSPSHLLEEGEGKKRKEGWGERRREGDVEEEMG